MDAGGTSVRTVSPSRKSIPLAGGSADTREGISARAAAKAPSVETILIIFSFNISVSLLSFCIVPVSMMLRPANSTILSERYYTSLAKVLRRLHEYERTPLWPAICNIYDLQYPNGP